MNRIIPTVVVAIAWISPFHLCAEAPNISGRTTNILEIQSVSVDSKPISINSRGKAVLGPFPKSVVLNFGPPHNAARIPTRLRYKLDGFDSGWREVGGEMNLTVRFYNDAGDQINQSIFTVSGDSPGWDGSLKTSLLTHRREAVVVPPQSSRIMIVVSSAGGPDTVGIYVVDNLVISRISANGESQVLLRWPFDSSQKSYAENFLPDGWMHDGTHPSMARIVEVGKDPASAAFAVLDDDPFSHAEWHNVMITAPQVSPGDHLVVEWNEMYSIGIGNAGTAYYDSLPSGNYQFEVEETTAMGVPTGVVSQLAVVVPQPFWKKPWFSVGLGLMLVFMIVAVSRYIVWQRARKEMLHLKNQRALEQERLRIAHDIHDDLGARVTQISLLSGMAQKNDSLPGKVRTDLDRISQMSRDLISALYETVWAVNPENDNLDALGNFLCQMANQMCEPARLSCWLEVQDLPKNIQVSSHIRHNITLAVKESLNNVIKHAGATEIVMRITFDGTVLVISIRDNGRGFDAGDPATGNGLKNISLRLGSIGGSSVVESQPGKGATVTMRLSIKSMHYDEQPAR